MSIGHRIACEMAYRDKAYAVIFTPDCMLSEGRVSRLQELARSGMQLVLTAALRFGEEPFLAHLRDLGVLPDEGHGKTARPSPSRAGRWFMPPLTVSTRNLGL